MLVAVVYLVLGVATAAYIWIDAEFREVDRLVFALLGFLLWPLGLPWYLIARPPSLVRDMQYEQSHAHYRDFVKTKSRDLGDGVDEDIARREEEAKADSARKEQRRRNADTGAPDADFDDPRPNVVIIGGSDPSPEPPRPAAADWANIPGQPPAKPAPRQSYGSGSTEQMESIRARLYGEGTGSTAPPAPSEGTWNLPPATPPPARPPKPAAPSAGAWNLTAESHESEADLPIPGAPARQAPFQDRNLDRLIEEGQLREAHRVAKRMLEMATRLGEAERQAGYQQYFLNIERRIAAAGTPLDD